jgi:hypothetical protein
MTERKFGALADLKKKQTPASPPIDAPEAMVRSRGRPAGKRSDPAYEPTTLLLRKSTKKAAFRLLEDTDSPHDLSDLTEQLLAEWIAKQS